MQSFDAHYGRFIVSEHFAWLYTMHEDIDSAKKKSIIPLTHYVRMVKWISCLDE